MSQKETLNGAQLAVRLLERQGVRRITGIPGGAILPFYDALSQSQQITHILARHEQGAGFMAQGAARETAEEAGAEVEMGAFFSAMSIPRVGQVHVFYLARLLHDRFDPGHESLEARLFTEGDLPWDELAFTTVRETLKRFFTDRRLGQFGVHDVDIT